MATMGRRKLSIGHLQADASIIPKTSDRNQWNLWTGKTEKTFSLMWVDIGMKQPFPIIHQPRRGARYSTMVLGGSDSPY